MAIGDKKKNHGDRRQKIAWQRPLGRLVGIKDGSGRQTRLDSDRAAGDVQRCKHDPRRPADEEAEYGFTGNEKNELIHALRCRWQLIDQRRCQHGA